MTGHAKGDRAHTVGRVLGRWLCIGLAVVAVRWAFGLTLGETFALAAAIGLVGP